MAARFNIRNPSVKRILQEMKEIQQDTTAELSAEAVEENIFEWHFVVRGALDTEFEGGLYHGRILLPPEYPFKPPSFLMLTPNGRFETGVKVCLSISSHHPEHWQPSWSVRTALVALIAFMQTPGGGAIGALDYSKEERADLARKSRAAPPRFGNAERQLLTDMMHERMLKREKEAAAGSPEAAAVPVVTDSSAPGAPCAEAVAAAAEPAVAGGPTAPLQAVASPVPAVPPPPPPVVGVAEPAVAISPAPPPPAAPAQQLTQRVAAAGPAAPQTAPAVPACQTVSGQQAVSTWEEAGLTMLAVTIVVVIAALLLRKVFVSPASYDAISQSFM